MQVAIVHYLDDKVCETQSSLLWWMHSLMLAHIGHMAP